MSVITGMTGEEKTFILKSGGSLHLTRSDEKSILKVTSAEHDLMQIELIMVIWANTANTVGKMTGAKYYQI